MRLNPSTDSSFEYMTLLTSHQADLWAFIISQIPGSPDVDDVLQQTNLTLWAKQKQFELGTDFRAWAFTVARFEVLAYLKSRKRGNWLIFCDDLMNTIAEEAPDAIPEASVRLKLLEACMAKLQPEERTLLDHRYRSKSGLKSFAESTGRSVSALSVALHRIRDELRQCIERGLHQEGVKG